MPCKKTSSSIEPRLRRGARSATRGAVFLEAIVVISALTLGLIALVYVRDLYVKQLGASRLTRAAVIAHSMAGCKTNQPRDWLGKDLAEYTTQGVNQDQQSARGKDNGGAPAGAGDSAKASSLLQRSGATSSDGKGLLNPITEAEFAGQAKATGKEGALTGRSQTVFSGRVRAKSFVSCGDEVKDGDFDRVMGVMKDEISNLLGK
jgi:hypothetical protein